MIGQHVYPGKTSTRRVGNSLLTFQTELRGDPAAAFTDDFARTVPMPIN